MDIGTRIKNRRQEMHMTLEDLSRKTGVSRQTIFRYESGEIKNIPSDKIEAIASALVVSPAYIMGWKEEEAPSYYLDPEVARIAQEAYDNPDIRILFDCARDVSKEDLQTVIALVKSLVKKETGRDV